ncbi:MAG: hypothetical protein ABFS09_01010 [Thermodesulfobacteriota bacterium]
MRFLLCCVFLALCCCSCTKEEAKRAAFETLQSIKVQRCDDRLDDNCDERERFDKYQRERGETVEN